MLVYIVGVCLLLFFSWMYVWFRLIETALLAEPIKQVVLGFFVVAFVLQAARWILYRIKADLSWLIGPSYFSFGLLSHLLLMTLAKDILYILWWYVTPTHFDLYENWVNSWVSYVIFFGGLALNIWGAQTAYEGPEISNVEVDLRKNSDSQETLKIVQISDLHVGPIIKRNYVENVVRMANQQKPDLICVTGDLGDGDPEDLERDLAPLAELKAKFGVYYVTGNHEYYWNVDKWIQAAKLVGFKVLFNEGVLLSTKQPVWLAGVPDISAHRIRPDHVHSVSEAARNAPQEAVKILLAHQPRSCDRAESNGFDLMLCGHTHGGQYAPFTWMVEWFNPYSQGLNKHRRMWVYVNVGTGFWGPPLRIGVVSEITSMVLKI